VKNLTLKGIPEPLYRALKQRARASRRSLNSEAIVALESALLGAPLNATDILARVDAVRERVRGPYLTDAEINAAKRAGRP
jgi:antitoxin FitA